MKEMSKFASGAVRKGLLIALVAIIGSWLAAPSYAADSGYMLGSGDQIKITVFGEEDLSGQYEIDGSGIVAFPLVGEVKAAGGSARELERKIKAKLSEGYLKNPTISIEVLTYRPFFILGEVKRPGSYAYKNGLNLLNAVALAGGYTYRAKSSVWVLTRSGDSSYNEREITDGAFQIRPGDTIVIPERFF